MTDYPWRGSHRPMADGSRLFDLTEAGSYPPDVYDHPEYYATPGDNGWASVPIIAAVHGKPDAVIRIYRAVPDGVTDIHPGDWVSIEEGYARTHAILTDDPADDWPVITAETTADQLRSDGSSLAEFGYFGPTLSATVLMPKEES
jgi:hypothetical protein